MSIKDWPPAHRRAWWLTIVLAALVGFAYSWMGSALYHVDYQWDGLMAWLSMFYRYLPVPILFAVIAGLAFYIVKLLLVSKG